MATAELVRSRRDGFPEYTAYIDTGCDVYPSCLACPLERCRYDEPRRAQILNDERDRAILQLRREGSTIRAIASQFGLSRRRVFSLLARQACLR